MQSPGGQQHPQAYGYGAGSAQAAGQNMDLAFQATRAAQYDDVPAGIPQGRPPWIIPVIVGVVALFVGGGLAIIIALAR